MDEAAATPALCRLLELQSEALDFYAQAQENCPVELVREVFAALERDKRRLTAKLAAVQAALRAGRSLEAACSLVENGGGEARPPGVGLPEPPPEALAHDERMLARALELEEACLRHLESALRREEAPPVRFFLDQALEEERRHWVLLCDLRQYLERAAGDAGGL